MSRTARRPLRKDAGLPSSFPSGRSLVRPTPAVGFLAVALVFGGASSASAAPAVAVEPSFGQISQAKTQGAAALAALPGQALTATGDKFTSEAVLADSDGGKHVRYSRTHDGLPVIGGDVVVHLAPDGSPEPITAAQDAPITDSTSPTVSAASAAATARAAFNGKVGEVGTPKLIIDATADRPALSYETVVTGAGRDGFSKLHVVTDADTGKVLQSWDAHEQVGVGRSLYSGNSVAVNSTFTDRYMAIDTTRRTIICNHPAGTYNPYCQGVANDADNLWGNGTISDPNSVVVDAGQGVAKAFDLFKNKYGRDGIFADGTGVPVFVHAGASYPEGFNNAFYDSDYGNIVLGDGASNASPLAAVDVVAHEYTHGVTSQTANLNYFGESGGLNESTSDIFGTLAEFDANNPVDAPDYTMGEAVNFYGDHKPLRYMYHPSLDVRGTGTNAYASPDCYDSTIPGLDPHLSSGLGNKFFYMLAEGSNGAYGAAPTCGAAAVTGIGREKAGQIWYKALTTYMTSTTGYVAAGTNDARAATLSAATDLYGACSKEYQAVQAAWTATAVTGEDFSCHRTYSNTVDYAITDNSTTPVSSKIRSTILGTAPNPLYVIADIKHPRRGDVVIDLVSPGGKTWRLKNASTTDTTANLYQLFPVDGTGQASTGDWYLKVSDVRAGSTGYIDSWSLVF